jgi:hypothetical protein
VTGDATKTVTDRLKFIAGLERASCSSQRKRLIAAAAEIPGQG